MGELAGYLARDLIVLVAVYLLVPRFKEWVDRVWAQVLEHLGHKP